MRRRGAGTWVAGFALANQALVLALQAWVARRYGMATSVDAWIAAQAVPAIVAGGVAALASQIVLPALSRAREAHGEDGLRATARSAIAWFSLLTIGIAAGLALAPDAVIGAVTPGLSDPARLEARSLLRWIALGLAVSGPTTVASQLAYARAHFVSIAAWAPAASVLQLAAFAVAPSADALRWMVAAQSLAAVAALAVSWIAAGPMRGRRCPEAGFAATARVLAPRLGTVLLVAGCFRINQAVDAAFASTLAVGSLAALGYASRVIAIAQAVLSAPVASVVFARLSGHAARGEARAFSRETHVISEQVLFLSVGAAAVLAGLGGKAALLLLGPDEREGIETVGACFVALSGLVVCGAWGGLLTRACLAAGEDRLVLRYQAWIPLVANALLDALLVGPFGVVGLAAVTSANALLGLPLLERALRQRGVLEGSALPALARFGVSAAPVALLLHALPVPEAGPVLAASLCAYAIAGAAVYGILEACTRRFVPGSTPYPVAAATD